MTQIRNIDVHLRFEEVLRKRWQPDTSRRKYLSGTPYQASGLTPNLHLLNNSKNLTHYTPDKRGLFVKSFGGLLLHFE